MKRIKNYMWEILMMTSGHLYPQRRKDGYYLWNNTDDTENTVSCILCYRGGRLVGTLNHFNIDFPEQNEKKGNVFVCVKPSYQGKGIATELVKRGMKEFNINLQQQTYTPDGKKLYEKLFGKLKK